MAADVGYLVQHHSLPNNNQSHRNQYHTGNNDGPTADLITRDLLGESFSNICSSDSQSQEQELDLHLQIPARWPGNCLDLIKSGKVYLQKCSSSEPNHPAHKPIKLPPDSNNLDLKSATNIYKSVCTLDKVKAALDRVKHVQFVRRKFTIPTSSNSASSSAGASIVTNEVTLNLETTSMSSSSLAQREGALKLSVAGCTNCLMYVMISNENPKCPKCDSTVSLPVTKKKPRIDLDLNLHL